MPLRLRHRPGQRADRVHQRRVPALRTREELLGATGKEQPIKRIHPELRHTRLKHPKRHRKPLPEICMPVIPLRKRIHPLTKRRDRVLLMEEILALPTTEHPPLLGKEHEDDPVHHHEDLLIVRPARLIITPESLDQRPIQEPVPELLDRPDHVHPQILADLLPRQATHLVVHLKRLLAGRWIAGEPTRMTEPVESKKLRKTPVQEDPIEIELDVPGNRRMMIIPQNPDRHRIHQHRPGSIMPVQAVLQDVVRRRLPTRWPDIHIDPRREDMDHRRPRHPFAGEPTPVREPMFQPVGDHDLPG